MNNAQGQALFDSWNLLWFEFSELVIKANANAFVASHILWIYGIV